MSKVLVNRAHPPHRLFICRCSPDDLHADYWHEASDGEVRQHPAAYSRPTLSINLPPGALRVGARDVGLIRSG